MSLTEADVCVCGVRRGRGYHHEWDGTQCTAPAPDERQIAFAVKWLRAGAPGGRYGRKVWRDSYGAKHAVERWSRATGKPEYVSNGAMIVAALRTGVPVRWTKSINCKIRLDRRGLESVCMKETGPDKDGSLDNSYPPGQTYRAHTGPRLIAVRDCETTDQEAKS